VYVPDLQALTKTGADAKPALGFPRNGRWRYAGAKISLKPALALSWR